MDLPRASWMAALVQEVLKKNLFTGALFLFTAKRRDRIKALYWDRNGYIVWYKVIEGGEKFSWTRHIDAESITLTAEQLEWSLDGYDVWKMKPHQSLQFSHIN